MELAARCELDLALTYALRRPRLARQCATAGLEAARNAGRPDLVMDALEILRALNAKPAEPAFTDEELAWFRGPHREVAP